MLDKNPRIVRRLSFIPMHESGKIIRAIVDRELDRRYLEHKLTIAKAHKSYIDILTLNFFLLCHYAGF